MVDGRAAAFELAGPLREAIAAVREPARQRGLRLTVSAPARALRVAGDAETVRTELLQGLVAAMAALPDGAGLRVDVREQRGRVRVSVGALALDLPSVNEPPVPKHVVVVAPGRLDGRRVLVADDSRDAANGLVALLRRAGARAVAVYDGQAAVDAARAERPHGVVLDLDMPGLDGCEAARRMRGPGGVPVPCLIALTGSDRDEDRRRSAQAGFDRHFAKPVDLGALVAALAA